MGGGLGGNSPLQDRRGGARRAQATVALFAALASSAAAIGLTGVDTTLCVLGVGECRITEGRRSQLHDLVEEALVVSEPVWTEVFEERGFEPYRRPQAFLIDAPFDTESDCGVILPAQTPVYCRTTESIFIDLEAFNRLVQTVERDDDVTYREIGDTFPAYIVMHEVAHHVQTLTGDFDLYIALRRSIGEDDVEDRALVSRRLELQADCLAGVAAARLDQEFGLVTEQVLEEAVNSVIAVGDDTIQLATRGLIFESGFKHGSGEQRLAWLTTGFTAGEMSACDTWTVPAADL